MPALLLHMTMAQEAVDRSDVPPLIAEAAARERAALILGSVLPDLPYHANFSRQLVRHLARRVYLLSEWGDVLHTTQVKR